MILVADNLSRENLVLMSLFFQCVEKGVGEGKPVPVNGARRSEGDQTMVVFFFLYFLVVPLAVDCTN